MFKINNLTFYSGLKQKQIDRDEYFIDSLLHSKDEIVFYVSKEEESQYLLEHLSELLISKNKYTIQSVFIFADSEKIIVVSELLHNTYIIKLKNKTFDRLIKELRLLLLNLLKEESKLYYFYSGKKEFEEEENKKDEEYEKFNEILKDKIIKTFKPKELHLSDMDDALQSARKTVKKSEVTQKVGSIVLSLFLSVLIPFLASNMFIVPQVNKQHKDKRDEIKGNNLIYTTTINLIKEEKKRLAKEKATFENKKVAMYELPLKKNIKLSELTASFKKDNRITIIEGVVKNE